MPGPHPRRRRVGEHLLDVMGDVRDWAPPGWHWEMISDVRRLVRNRVLSSTRIFFGGGRVGHSRCRGSRPPSGLYADVSGRRTSMSVATWWRWTPGHSGPGRFFRDLTRATSSWWFLLFGWTPSAAPDVLTVLVMLFTVALLDIYV